MSAVVCQGNFVFLQARVSCPAAVPNHAANSKKRCVFCGSLYPGLREPGFALELFRALGPASGWTLTMAGGGWQYFAADAAQTKAVLGEQFEQPGPVPAETSRTMQAQADVLLNLGNAVDNQLPSKLFDYFAAGKPVLHLCVIENDPALPYLARYPLALVLRNSYQKANRAIAKAFEEEGDQRVIVGEEKLYLNEKEVAYSEIAHCYQLKHCFSIVYQGNHVYVIPKSVLNVEQAQELASLMQQKAPQAYHDLTQK